MSATLRAAALLVTTGLLAACTSGGSGASPSAAATAVTSAPATALPAPSGAAAVPAAAASPAPAPAATAASASAQVSTADLTPNDLLLAALSPSDVKAVVPATETWWPYFPEFDVGFSPYTDNSADPSVRFFVVQAYERVGGPARRQVVSTMVLFNDAASAAQGMARLNQTNDGDSTPASGPAVGDASSYFTRSNIGLGTPTDTPIDYPDTAVLRFRVGPVVGRVSVLGTGFEKTATLAAYAAPLVDRIGALLQGSLKAQPLPTEYGQRMPPPSSAVGAILGAVVAPAESWALADNSGTPEAVADKLHSLGAASLGFGRASLAADPNQVIEATLFPFRDATAASSWVKTFTSGVGKTGLDAGATGTQSAYTSYGGKFYELQFAAGRFVGDLSCFAPYGTTTSACEVPVRQLAEAWYAALSGS